MNSELKKSNPKLYNQYFNEIPKKFEHISLDFLASAINMEIVNIEGKPFLQVESHYYNPEYVDKLSRDSSRVQLSESYTLMAQLDENKKLTGNGVTIDAFSYGNPPAGITVSTYENGDNCVYNISSATDSYYNVADRSQISTALSSQRGWEKKSHFIQEILHNIDTYIKPNKLDALAATAYANKQEFGKKEYSPEHVEAVLNIHKKIEQENKQIALDETLIAEEKLNVEGHTENYKNTVEANSGAGSVIVKHARYWGKLMQIEMKKQNLQHLTPEIAKDTAHRADMKFGLSAAQFFASRNCLNINWKYGQELAEIYKDNPADISKRRAATENNSLQAKQNRKQEAETRLGKLRNKIAKGVDKVTEVTGIQQAAEKLFHKDIRTEPIKMKKGVKKFEKDVDNIIDKVISNKNVKQ